MGSGGQVACQPSLNVVTRCRVNEGHTGEGLCLWSFPIAKVEPHGLAIVKLGIASVIGLNKIFLYP